MSDTKAEQKPPTLADIVREKTDDGKRIIDFFLDVMEGRIDGAELCHRIDAAKQLEKHKSKAAARFLAKYRGVSCGHSTGGRPDPADPCSAEERSLVAVTLNAPATLTQDFLTVLSGIDEFLMARLIRAQTADGGTIIDFLDDVIPDSPPDMVGGCLVCFQGVSGCRPGVTHDMIGHRTGSRVPSLRVLAAVRCQLWLFSGRRRHGPAWQLGRVAYKPMLQAGSPYARYGSAASANILCRALSSNSYEGWPRARRMINLLA